MLTLRSSGGDPGYELRLVGDAVPNSKPTVFVAKGIELAVIQGGHPLTVITAPLSVQLFLSIDLSILDDNGGIYSFKTFRTLDDEAKKCWYSTWHQLQNIELDWSEAGGNFFHINLPVGVANVSGVAAFNLDGGADPQTNLEADISFHSSFNFNGAMCGWSLRLQVGATVGLRSVLDDLHVNVPLAINLPGLATLDLTRPITLALATGTSIAYALQQLCPPGIRAVIQWMDSTATNNIAPPLLALKWDTTQNVLCFAYVPNGAQVDFSLNAGGIAPQLPQAFITFTTPSGTAITLGNCRVVCCATTSSFEATIGVANLPNLTGSVNLGPFALKWKDVSVYLAPVPIAGPGIAAMPAANGLRARLHFPSLSLSLVNDPGTVLTLSGDVDLSPSSITVTSLEIVDPTRLAIDLTGDSNFLNKGADSLQRILLRLDHNLTSGFDKLLDVLGKFGAALCSTPFTFPWADGGPTDGYEPPPPSFTLCKTLKPLGELASALFKKLGDLPSLLSSGGSSFQELQVELRISTSPLQLRQILVRPIETPATAATRGTLSLSVLGFQLDIQKGWNPALLIDLATAPGAYLLFINQLPAETNVASLSTDLWLKTAQTGATSAMHDSDSTTGQRPVKPLLEIDVTSKTATFAFMLVGLQSGSPVFLKRANTAGGLIPLGAATPFTVMDGPITFTDVTTNDFNFGVQFQKERILALFGMDEPQQTAAAPAAGGTFLDQLKNSLGQVVTVTGGGAPTINSREVDIPLSVTIQVAGLSSATDITVKLSLDTLNVTVDSPKDLSIAGEPIHQSAMGLYWVVEPKPKARQALPASTPAKYNLFKLSFANGETRLSLGDDALMEVHFNGLSPGGDGIVFSVTKFSLGRSGLDLEASVTDRAVTLNGLDVPFQFTKGSLSIVGGNLTNAMVEGKGKLPSALIGDCGCTINLTFGKGDSGIALQSGHVDLDKKGEPIVCHSTRFTICITDIELGFAVDGGYHFYFLIDGSLRFTPNAGEFEDGLLKFLNGVEITLTKAPLTGDASVLLKHISFQKSLSPKKTFTLFDVFKMELRGFGYHPASPVFDGNPPAISLSGQITLGLGDLMNPKIDFHQLWIAPPAKGESLPRIKAEGLGIELQLAGGARIKGTVLAVDKNNSPTLEGVGPAGLEASGFLGSGLLDIPGWGTMEASMGFLQVNKPGQDKKIAFFLYLQQDKIAVEIPTPFWVFYLREVGFGFGYRYTLASIREADTATSAAQLIKILDKASTTQGDMSNYTAWEPDPDGDKFTLALKGAIQVAPADEDWDDDDEKAMQNPFLLDVVMALRSDLTFLISARVHLGVNYYHYLENKDDLRSNPILRGFMYISVPRSELLLRTVSNPSGHLGLDEPLFLTPPLPELLKSVTFSSTLYIRPGLFQYEMGWPNQLSASLIKSDNLTASVCGGMIFRAADDGLLFGLNAEAQIDFHFGGGIDLGLVGASLQASLTAKLVARFIAYLAWHFKDSLVYAMVSLDARLDFSVSAWLHIDLWMCSINININFTFTLQFTAVVELVLSPEGVGAHVEASVAIQVFGCTLGIDIGFTLSADRLSDARARVARFLTLSLTAEEPAPAPVLAASSGDQQLQDHAAAQPPTAAQRPAASQATRASSPSRIAASSNQPLLPATDFWLVFCNASVAPRAIDSQPLAGGEYAYALLVPKEGVTGKGSFYSSPVAFPHSVPAPAAPPPQVPTADQTLIPGINANLPELWFYEASTNKFRMAPPRSYVAATQWQTPLSVDKDSSNLFCLCHAFDTCFLTDAAPGSQPGQPPGLIYSEPTGLAHVQTTDLSETESQRNQKRLQQQKLRALAADNPSEKAYKCRSVTMQLFLDQFVTLAQNGSRTDAPVQAGGATQWLAHVGDLGLLFYGKVSELEKLTDCQVLKKDSDPKNKGGIALLNPRGTWFDKIDPVLANTRTAIEPDGIKIDWQLQLGLPEEAEHYLHHYEVVRTSNREEITPVTVLAKGAATRGEVTNGKINLQAPDWQMVDSLDNDLALPTGYREALLPTKAVTDAAASAIAWVTAFNADTFVVFTYTVTPVDIAGVRGIPKSFVVKIERPQPVIRPALGQLYIQQTWTYPQTETTNASDEIALSPTIYLATCDDAWDANTQVSDKYRAERSYNLILLSEELEPSGHYGNNGATARSVSPALSAALQQAQGIAIPLDYASTNTVSEDDKIRIEPDEETRRKFPRWGRLTIQQNAQDPISQIFNIPAGPRCGYRFCLETVVTVTTLPDKKSYSYRSDRVPVAVEHLVVVNETGKDANGNDTVDPKLTGTFQPDVFEVVRPVALPVLSPGQVQATCGFASYVAPTAAATLADRKLIALRDAGRESLVTVSFAVVPQALAASPDVSCIAEYQLFELDADSYVSSLRNPLDSKTLAQVSQRLSVMPDAWQEARLVGRVELLTDDAAHLVPEGNQDFNGWQAHYPSETQKCQNPIQPTPTSDTPILPAWYSAAESTVNFPLRLPRMRFFPQAPESALGDLFQNGLPQALVFSIVAQSQSKADRTWGANISNIPLGLVLKELTDPQGGSYDFGIFVAGSNPFTVIPKNIVTMEPRHVRHALLGMGVLNWTIPSLVDAVTAWQNDPTAWNGLQVQIQALRDRTIGAQDETNVLSTVLLDLDLRSPQHPLLEELLGELSYAYDQNSNAFYRTYVVNAQPAPPMSDRTLAGFLGRTQAGTDPYGWGVLQSLGLASAIRIFDAQENDFLAPDVLAGLVDLRFTAVLKRWQAVPNYSSSWGDSFAEIHLKPGADRRSEPFDSVVVGSVQPGAPSFNLRQDGLSLLQVSLRPTLTPVWCYYTLTLNWNPDFWKAAWPDAAPVQFFPRKTSDFRLIFETPANLRGTLDIALLASGDFLNLTSSASGQLSIPLPTWTTSLPVSHVDASELTLVVRVRCDQANLANGLDFLDPAGLSCLVELENGKGDKVVRKLRLSPPAAVPAAQPAPFVAKKWQQNAGVWNLVPSAWQAIAAPGAIVPDPFGRFEAKPGDEWAHAMAQIPPSGYRLDRIPTQRFGDLFTATKSSLGWTVPIYIDPAAADAPVQNPLAISFAAAFAPWVQRFLDHGRAPAAPPPAAPSPWLAVAAPKKALPWRLAPDGEGKITLNFTYADNWAHLRAYAVKPVSRYQHLLDKLPSQELATRLVDASGSSCGPIGCAVAVTHRTEKVERPLVVVIPPDDMILSHDRLHLVVARHAEESRANSNRLLLANLEKPGPVWTHSRVYRYADWIDQLTKYFASAGMEWDKYPTLDAKIVKRPTGPNYFQPIPLIQNLTESLSLRLSTFAQRYPKLYEGASLYAIDLIPSHYELVVLCSQRAGLTVSDATSVRFPNLPRRDIGSTLPSTSDFDTPYDVTMPGLTVAADGSLNLTHLLVSHATLSPESTRSWMSSSDAEDVAWAPDPGMIYILERANSVVNNQVTEIATTGYQEEDVEVRLGCFDSALAVVPCTRTRARGTRYQTSAINANPPASSIAAIPVPNKRSLFNATTLLKLQPQFLGLENPDQVRLTKDDCGDNTDANYLPRIYAFNTAAAAFGAIVYYAGFGIGLDAVGASTPQQYAAYLTALMDGVYANVDPCDDKILFPDAKRAIKTSIDNGRRKLATLPMTTAQDVQNGMRGLLSCQIFMTAGGTLPRLAPIQSNSVFEYSIPIYLRLWALAPDTSIQTMQNQNPRLPMPPFPPFPFVKAGGTMSQRYKTCLLGGMDSFWLKIIDSRTVTVPDVDASTFAKGQNPGILRVKVSLPTCAT